MRSDSRVAVIGAGISGLTFARELNEKFEVTVFEKANRPGGRVTSKVINGADFDYGAQFFTAKTASFKTLVNDMQSEGVVGDWQGHFIEFDHTTICSQRPWDDEYPHYVGVPNMSAMTYWMAEPLNIHYHSNITRIERKAEVWHLYDGDVELGQFDWVILTMPPEQVCELLSANHVFYQQLATIKMKACFALRVVLNEEVDLGFNAALVRNHDVSWISKNSSKPERSGAPCIIVQSTNNWADAHLNDDLLQVEQHMLGCLNDITGLRQSAIASSDVKKWVFANAPRQSGSDYLLDSDGGIAICGDGLVHGRIESAFTSAQQLANAVLKDLNVV
jgi:renalase